MKKTNILISCLAFSALAMQAEVLTPEQALSRAQGNAPAIRAAMGVKNQPQLVFTASSDGQPGAYVFNTSSSGYVVLAADDMATPILGYSDQGTIDPDNMPAALTYWLDMYAQEIQYARSNGYAAATAESRAQDFAPIAPLCTTEWDQGAPYNDLAPMQNGRHAYTGCVATAMAQKMKYHNYPAVGEGTLVNNSLNQITTVDLSKYPFDWANMLNSYNSMSTEAQKKAVAELMLCCGMTVEMKYGLDQSGAVTNYVPYALAKYFKYSKGCHLLTRDHYTLAQWEKYVYDELSQVGPVVYAGVTANQEGHCWVCDGYSSDGYFHLNWGWGGISDGYYKLTALDPLSQGIGGAASAQGFNYTQRIVVGARAEEGGDYYYEIYCSEGFGISKSKAALGTTIKATGGFYNSSIVEVSGTLGLNVTDSQGNVRYVRGINIKNLAMMTGYSSYSIILPYDLEDGTYTIAPAWVSSDYEYHEILTPITKVSSYTMKVEKGVAYFTPNEKESRIEISDVKTVSEHNYIGQTLKFSMTVANHTNYEFYSEVAAGLYTPGTEFDEAEPLYEGNAMLLNVAVGEQKEYVYSSAFKSAVPGDYAMVMYDVNTNQWLSEPIYIKLTTAQMTQFTIDNFSLVNAQNVNGQLVADPNNLQFEFDITCTQGFLASELYVAIQQETEQFYRSFIETEAIELLPGETKHVVVYGYFRGQNDKNYSAYVCDGPSIADKQHAGPINFVCNTSGENANTTGIGSAINDESAVEYYNLQGIKILAPAAGTPCIKAVKSSDGSVRFTKIVK